MKTTGFSVRRDTEKGEEGAPSRQREEGREGTPDPSARGLI